MKRLCGQISALSFCITKNKKNSLFYVVNATTNLQEHKNKQRRAKERMGSADDGQHTQTSVQ